MARTKGIIKVEGTIDGINFYKRNGENLARAAGGGFSGKAIKTSPKMVRVRENMSEFGQVSSINKQLRLALHPFYVYHKDGTLAARLQQLFFSIKDCDTISVRGERKVSIGFATPMGRYLFEQFAFAANQDVSMAFAGKGHFNWDDFSYTVDDVAVSEIRFPASATHLEVRLGVLQFDFDAPKAVLHLSAAYYVSKDNGATGFTLLPEALPNGEGALIAFRCVRFYQELSGEKYILKEKGLIGVDVLGVL